MPFRLRRATDRDANAIAELFFASYRLLTFLPMLHTIEGYRWFVASVMLKECAVTVVEDDTGIISFLARQGEEVRQLYTRPDRIGRGAGTQLIEAAKRNLESYGLTVTLAPNIAKYGERTYLAGTDAERLTELNQFLNSDEFDAFFFARGGYGAMRILDGIDYAAIRRNPRPIIGFSDLTALHQATAIHSGVASFHGPMVNLDFFHGLSPHIDQWFWSMLGGDAPLE